MILDKAGDLTRDQIRDRTRDWTRDRIMLAIHTTIPVPIQPMIPASSTLNVRMHWTVSVTRVSLILKHRMRAYTDPLNMQPRMIRSVADRPLLRPRICGQATRTRMTRA